MEQFRSSLHGPLLRPSDTGYEEARHVWNGMIDNRPALIAHCTGVADVIAAVNFAREQNLLVAVRGGGHNAAGNATCDDGLVIDLSLIRGVHVDPKGRTVRAQGGATWGDLDRETQVFGLATPGGAVSTTGIAGLTLGGGLGWLQRKYGLSCDNLISVDVVTADGQLVTVSAEEHPDLFWAAVATLAWSPRSSTVCTQWVRWRSFCSFSTRRRARNPAGLARFYGGCPR